MYLDIMIAQDNAETLFSFIPHPVCISDLSFLKNKK